MNTEERKQYTIEQIFAEAQRTMGDNWHLQLTDAIKEKFPATPSTPANVGIDFQKLETLAWQVEKGQISADVLVEWVKKMSTRDSANVGGGLEIFKQIAANAWNSAYGGDSFLSGEDYAESLNFSDVTLPASPSLPDNIEHWVEKLYPISDEFTDNSEDIVKRERSAFIRGLKSQVQSQAASPSLGEIEKNNEAVDLILASIMRIIKLAPYHINPYNLGDMGEISSQLRTIAQLLPKVNSTQFTPPSFPTREEAETKANELLATHIYKSIEGFGDGVTVASAVSTAIEIYEWVLSLNEFERDFVRQVNLQVGLSKGTAGQGWIDVKDKAPELQQSVAFVVDSGNEQYNGKVYGGKYLGCSFGEHEFTVPGICFSAKLWQPLPSPPNTQH